MELLNQFPSLSGNIAIDLAILFVMALGVLRVAKNVAKRSAELAAERVRTRHLSAFLRQKEAQVEALRETFLRARERTRQNVRPLTEEQHSHAELAGAQSDIEHDPRYEDLEEQLRVASQKRSPLER